MGEDGGSGGGGGDAGGLTHLSPGARSHSGTHTHTSRYRVILASSMLGHGTSSIQLSGTGGTVLIRGLHTYTSYTYITLLAYLRAAA